MTAEVRGVAFTYSVKEQEDGRRHDWGPELCVYHQVPEHSTLILGLLLNIGVIVVMVLVSIL